MNSREAEGIDALVRDPGGWSSLDWAMVTNDAALDMHGAPSRVSLLKAGFRIQRLFAPEHGITAAGADGVRQEDRRDELTGLPVVSLYGERFSPTAEQLSDVDGVIFDIPDIGCRFYTYLWTLSHTIEACAAQGRRLLVLDRRNPIGTVLSSAEGPWLDEARCASFLGRWNIPLKHACTLGELALYFSATRVHEASVDVVRIPGYERRHAKTDDPFTQTSPAMPHLRSALVYPGLCLLEGLNVNEGRGTDAPFARFGAPWIDFESLSRSLSEQGHSGIEWQTEEFPAVNGPHAGSLCKGLFLRVSDPASFMAVRFGVSLIGCLHRLHGDLLEAREYRTHANPSGTTHLDRLLGLPEALEKLRSGHVPELEVGEAWSSIMEPHLLYPRIHRDDR